MIPFGQQQDPQEHIDKMLSDKIYLIDKILKGEILEKSAILYGRLYQSLLEQGFSQEETMQILLQFEIGK